MLTNEQKKSLMETLLVKSKAVPDRGDFSSLELVLAFIISTCLIIDENDTANETDNWKLVKGPLAKKELQYFKDNWVFSSSRVMQLVEEMYKDRITTVSDFYTNREVFIEKGTASDLFICKHLAIDLPRSKEVMKIAFLTPINIEKNSFLLTSIEETISENITREELLSSNLEGSVEHKTAQLRDNVHEVLYNLNINTKLDVDFGTSHQSWYNNVSALLQTTLDEFPNTTTGYDSSKELSLANYCDKVTELIYSTYDTSRKEANEKVIKEGISQMVDKAF